MIPLDSTGRPPVPEVAIRQDGSSIPASLPEQSDFGRWLAQEGNSAGSDASPQNSATEPPLAVVRALASPSAGEVAATGVLYAWQIHSQQFLSQLGPTSLKTEVEPRGALAVGPGTSQAPVLRAGLGSGQGTVIVPGESAARGVPNVVGAFAATGIREAERPGARDVVAGAVASATWTERMLRSIELPNRSITLWLRDYRLDQSDISATVDELLRTHPDRERVARVLVNGHEAWREQPLESRRK